MTSTQRRPDAVTTPPPVPAQPSPDRERLLSAAWRAFAERGWSGTHVDELEHELGLVLGRARSLVGSKGELLWLAMAYESRMGGRTLEQVVADLRLADRPTVDERLDVVVGLVCQMHRAIAPLVPAIAEGALVDASALAMRQGSDLRRLAISRTLVELLARDGAPLPDAAEVVHVVIMTETYATFARNGWPMERYAAWLRATLDRTVNGGRAG